MTNQGSVNTRLTWQATQRNKFNLYYEHQTRDNVNTGAAQLERGGLPFHVPQAVGRDCVSWVSPLTNRLLIEARLSTARGGHPQQVSAGPAARSGR